MAGPGRSRRWGLLDLTWQRRGHRRGSASVSRGLEGRGCDRGLGVVGGAFFSSLREFSDSWTALHDDSSSLAVFQKTPLNLCLFSTSFSVWDFTVASSDFSASVSDYFIFSCYSEAVICAASDKPWGALGCRFYLSGKHCVSTWMSRSELSEGCVAKQTVTHRK